MANVFGKSLLGLVAVLVVSGVTTAQEDAFKEGVRFLRLGQRTEALAKFRDVIAADPSNEDALRLYQSISQDEWYMLLGEEGDIQQIARSLLERAKLERAERSRDDDEIASLVEIVCSKDSSYEDRRAAINKLVANHGEFAVPALVERLGNADDADGQVLAIVALKRIGHAAALPLVEALKSTDVNIRASVAASLTHIRDRRSVPAMAALVQLDDQESVRDIARNFLAKMGVMSSAVDLYVAQARSYLVGNGVRPGELSEVVWSFADGNLSYIDVPVEIYGLELAKKSAHEALEVDPVRDDARSLVAQSYLAQAAVIEQSLAQNPDDENLAPLADKVALLRIPALAAGPEVLASALTESSATGLVPVAVGAIQALAETESRSSLARCTPLIAALNASDSRISYAAALALVQASGGVGVPAADQVVRNLANAVTEESIRMIHVIDPGSDIQAIVETANGTRGNIFAVDADSPRAIDSLYNFPSVDVVVINEILPTGLPEDVIGLIRKDSRMADVKILIMAKDPDAAGERFDGKADAVIARPDSGDSLVEAVNSALEGVPVDASNKRAEQIAMAASEALSLLADGKVNIGQALESLAGQLDRADSIAIPAARALGLSGGANQLDALMGAVNGSGSVELKVAAARSMGEIMGRMGDAPGAVVEGLMALLATDIDTPLKAAIGAALGKARLAPGDKLRLIEALRTVGGSVDGDM